MKVLGIGNAIIDVICKVEENFIKNIYFIFYHWWQQKFIWNIYSLCSKNLLNKASFILAVKSVSDLR